MISAQYLGAGGPDSLVEAPSISAVPGALVICGGGQLPEQVPQRFLELAGGKDARVVIVTTASRYADSPAIERTLAFWRRQETASLHILHTSDRETADNPAFSQPLTEATGVWFVGGDQNKVTRVYLGTKTQQRLHELLDRGGVIGGTSAGAAIMSQVMITGGREEPRLGSGLGFLSGAIVDQHFLKRRRQARLVKAVCARPGHLGLGIDEGTAIVVQGTKLSVLGESEVRVCHPMTAEEEPRVETLKAGDSADLQVLCGIVANASASAEK